MGARAVPLAPGAAAPLEARARSSAVAVHLRSALATHAQRLTPRAGAPAAGPAARRRCRVRTRAPRTRTRPAAPARRTRHPTAARPRSGRRGCPAPPAGGARRRPPLITSVGRFGRDVGQPEELAAQLQPVRRSPREPREFEDRDCLSPSSVLSASRRPQWMVRGVPTGMRCASARMSALRKRMHPWETRPGTSSGRSVPWMPDEAARPASRSPPASARWCRRRPARRRGCGSG